jgi:hypothetical protein
MSQIQFLPSSVSTTKKKNFNSSLHVLVTLTTWFLNKTNLRPNKRQIKKQATRHDCLSTLLGNGDKETKIVYGEEKIFYTGLTREARQDKNLLYRHEEPNQGRTSFICTL